MAAISLSIVNGVGSDNWTQLNNITVGTTAPSTGDVQLCWNTSDTASPTPNVLGRADVLHAVKAFMYALESQSLFTTGSSGP